MLANERRMALLEEMGRSGRIITSTMAARLGVSEVTIRADLDELERRGRVRRTHGGAVAPDLESSIISFDSRMALHHDEKRRIAQRAARYLESSETVIFDAGSTIHALAQQVPNVANLRVYTPGLSIAQQLLNIEGVETNLMGGCIDPTWGETTGTPREQGIGDLLVQKLFLAAMGVDGDLDIVDASPNIARGKQQFARRARFIVLLLDSSKWGLRGTCKVMPLDRVDVVITDEGINKPLRDRIEQAGVELIIA